MSQRNKYVELVVPDSSMPKHYVAGYEVVSDSRQIDGRMGAKRHLFLKKRGDKVEDPVAEKSVVRKKKKKKMDPAAQPATAFDTSKEESNG